MQSAIRPPQTPYVCWPTKIDDLSRTLEDKDKQIAQEQELLEHDRDIRNVIAARNLYIAEIYDVGETGDTEKLFRRVFYTKDQSQSTSLNSKVMQFRFGVVYRHSGNRRAEFDSRHPHRDLVRPTFRFGAK